MAATFSKLKNYFAHWREWEINPIVIKELRQGVRSQTFSGMLIISLVLMFFGVTFALTDGGMFWSGSSQTGCKMFNACLAILACGTLIFVPMSVGIRVGVEQHESDMSLFTPLPIPKLVQGKFLGGLYIAGLLFSVCVPFMTLSSLNQGPDWLTIPIILTVLFFTTCLAIIGAISVAVVPVRIAVKMIFAVLFFCASIIVCLAQLSFFFKLVRLGAADVFTLHRFVSSMFPLFGLGFFVAITFYSFAKTNIIREGRPQRMIAA